MRTNNVIKAIIETIPMLPGVARRWIHPTSLFELRRDKKDRANFVMFFTLRESRRDPDPALSRVRGSTLQLHPFRLDSEALRLLQRWGRLKAEDC